MGIKEHVIKSCRYLLLPVVRFVLRHGVTIAEFEELTKDAYVQVARQDYGIEGRPTNNARVAMLTGLSRREVAKVRDRLLDGGLPGEETQGNRISQILTGWHVDAEFTDANGQPKVLPATGPTGSLQSLLKREDTRKKDFGTAKDGNGEKKLKFFIPDSGRMNRGTGRIIL